MKVAMVAFGAKLHDTEGTFSFATKHNRVNWKELPLRGVPNCIMGSPGCQCVATAVRRATVGALAAPLSLEVQQAVIGI